MNFVCSWNVCFKVINKKIEGPFKKNHLVTVIRFVQIFEILNSKEHSMDFICFIFQFFRIVTFFLKINKITSVIDSKSKYIIVKRNAGRKF